jgi:hypothetical protein
MSGGIYAYVIRLDANSRPQNILLEAGGLDAGMSLSYTDYIQKGNAYVPKKAIITPSKTSQLAIELTLNQVDVSPAGIIDKDFDPPKKGLSFRR